MLSKLVNLSFFKNTTPALQQRLEGLVSSGISLNFIEKWLQACDSNNDIERLVWILEKLAKEQHTHKELLNRINESPFSTTGWSKATLVFLEEEKDNLPHLNVNHMFGYLSCCAESVSSQPILEPFETVVKTMLLQFGYDGEDA